MTIQGLDMTKFETDVSMCWPMFKYLYWVSCPLKGHASMNLELYRLYQGSLHTRAHIILHLYCLKSSSTVTSSIKSAHHFSCIKAWNS